MMLATNADSRGQDEYGLVEGAGPHLRAPLAHSLSSQNPSEHTGAAIGVRLFPASILIYLR